MLTITPTFPPPSLDVARQNLTALLEAFERATGLAPTYIGIIARGGDPKFCRSYLEKDFGFESYDIVVSRLSALWPENAAWPEGVPRLAPAPIEAREEAFGSGRTRQDQKAIHPDEFEVFRNRLAQAAARRGGSKPEKENANG